ncbi:hypothetical protein [Nakamurella sp.]|uniref:hypothetical protein n=1 Tax=Nakamurella sp. TaxID=1869182 RepID=UPI003B3A6940
MRARRMPRTGRPAVLALALAAVVGGGAIACAAPAGPAGAGALAVSSSPATAIASTPTPTEPSTQSSPAGSGSGADSGVASSSDITPGTTVTPSDLGAATCFSTPELDRSDNSIGIAFGYKEGESAVSSPGNTVSVAMFADACHQSLVSRGAIKESDPVAACVLADGTVGVLPGQDELCATLDLPVAERDASAPIPP